LHDLIRRNASIETFRLCLNVWPESITICNDSNQSPLRFCIETIGTKRAISTTTPTSGTTTPPMFKVFQFLLKSCPSQAKERNDDDGKTILHYAVENGLPIEIIRSILNSCPESVQIKDKNSGMISLHYIVCNTTATTTDKYHQDQNQALFVVQLLMDIYPNSAKVKDNMGNTPLHYVLKQLTINAKIIKEGASNITKNNIDIFRCILNKCPDGMTPLQYLNNNSSISKQHHDDILMTRSKSFGEEEEEVRKNKRSVVATTDITIDNNTACFTRETRVEEFTIETRDESNNKSNDRLFIKEELPEGVEEEENHSSFSPKLVMSDDDDNDKNNNSINKKHRDDILITRSNSFGEEEVRKNKRSVDVASNTTSSNNTVCFTRGTTVEESTLEKRDESNNKSNDRVFIKEENEEEGEKKEEEMHSSSFPRQS